MGGWFGLFGEFFLGIYFMLLVFILQAWRYWEVESVRKIKEYKEIK